MMRKRSIKEWVKFRAQIQSCGLEKRKGIGGAMEQKTDLSIGDRQPLDVAM
jgi:hypothetical protein